MTRLFLTLLASLLALPGLAAAPVPAEGVKGTTFPYPAKAPVVVCLNGYDKARDRLSKMLKAALPDDAARLTKLLDSQLNKLLEGRKLTGIRKDARAFLVLNDIAGLIDGNYPLSVLIPVTSYQEFRDTFLSKDEIKSFDKGREGVDTIKTAATGEEATVFLIDLKEYVALTLEKTVAESYVAKYTAGSTDSMGSDVADTFLKADLALYVNMDAINDQFGDQIRGFRGLIDFGLQQAQQQGALPGLNKKQLDAMKVVFKGMFQGIEDCRSVVVAGEFRPEGLLFRLQGRFAQNTPSAKLIQSETSTAMQDLNKLPKGLSMYSESRLGETLGKLLREMNQEFATPEDDDKAAATLEQQAKERLAAGFRGEWTASNMPGTSLTVSDYKEPAQAVKAITKSFQAIPAGGKVNSVVLKSAPRLNIDVEKHQGFTFTEVRLQFDLDATVASLPEAGRDVTLENLKRTVPEKMALWLGSNGKVVINITAPDWTAAKTILDKYLDAHETIGTDPGFKATRDQLPTQATMLVIAETGSTLTGLLDSVRAVAQAIPGVPQIGSIKAPKGEPTFVGFAITMKDDTIGMTAFVPTGAIAVGRKMLEGLLRNVE